MDCDVEPMDVDLSGNSMRHTDAMDISYNDLNQSALNIKIKDEPVERVAEVTKNNILGNDVHTSGVPTVIKRFSLQRKVDGGKTSNTTLSIIFAILSLATILIYHIVKFECSKEIDLEALRKSLTKNVIGQSQALEEIIASFEEKSSSKILLFYGGTGVGKTLTISIILDNSHHYANIYHYTMPSFVDTFSADLMLGLTFCPNSMIIVDDLNNTDITRVKDHVKKVVDKSENLSKNITIILVFNCDIVNDQYVKKCDHSFGINLLKAFAELKAKKQLIKFHSLTEEHLRWCIEKELEGKRLSYQEIESIIQNFNVSVDGCKGVYTKMKLLHIN